MLVTKEIYYRMISKIISYTFRHKKLFTTLIILLFTYMFTCFSKFSLDGYPHVIKRINYELNKDNSKIKLTCNKCFTLNVSYLINNKSICKNDAPDKTIDILILISTVSDHFETRQTLRSTWLNYTRKNTANVRYVFLLGDRSDYGAQMSDIKENAKYKDIIKGSFIDTYRNLTYKTILGLKWAVSFCSTAKFVLKTDDDVYVNIPNILKLINNKKEDLDKALVGHCTSIQAVERRVSSKSYIPKNIYTNDMYLPFCSGTGYISSMDLIKDIYKVSINVTFFPLEDVYIGMCAKVLSAKLIDIKGFKSDTSKRNHCILKDKNVYTIHNVSSSELKYIWTSFCPGL
ncbi:beta-1,3-galactosyltransferase 1-like [Mercenaria mercenaria]|uniref:beta-1,3-galactosyltransferase 1-like n=1 Tax=Mercenaria mercenaria TaxID=6596 RepID=UPI00234F6603|nr:beta-1,3-galactosyltransferase 1-like [Mercenaria mercenaria]